MYAKIVDGALVQAPKEFINEDGTKTCGFTADYLLSKGYKPVVYGEYPEDGQEHEQVLTESEDCITVSYI